MPIDQLEREVRSRGVFMLVDLSDRKLRFFGFKRAQADINRATDIVKGRSDEMTKYLIARARAER